MIKQFSNLNSQISILKSQFSILKSQISIHSPYPLLRFSASPHPLLHIPSSISTPPLLRFSISASPLLHIPFSASPYPLLRFSISPPPLLHIRFSTPPLQFLIFCNFSKFLMVMVEPWISTISSSRKSLSVLMRDSVAVPTMLARSSLEMAMLNG